MDKLLIIVDMQKDFIDGALANPAAQAIVPSIVDFVKTWEGKIGVTFDTHQKNYMETQEGKNLPVPHCIINTTGHALDDEIEAAIHNKVTYSIMKPTFGYDGWRQYGLDKHFDEVVLVGTCTDICVISNALAIKAACPETKVTVIADLCAGLSTEKHEAALEVMRSCQVNVI